MNSLLKKIDIYLQVKVLEKIDSNIWKFSKDNFDKYLISNKYDKDAINKYYPDIDTDKLKEANPEDLFLMEQFMSYVYKFEQPMLVEPLYGWAIPGGFEVFKRSFPYVSDIWDKNKRKPSTVKYLLPSRKIEIESAIPVRYYWQNYYHFFIDTLSQVYIANKYVPMDVPILVPYYFDKIKYVREFLKDSTFLNGRKIIVQQKNEYYLVKNLYICKDVFYSDSVYDVVASFGGLIKDDSRASKKIFLTRAADKNRSIKNSAEIEQIAREAGYEIKDTEGMSLKEQVALFANTDTLVGLHGAGLTNIIFRNKRPMKLLEIFPADSKPDHYRNICTQLNYKYDYILGGNRDFNDKVRFHLDPIAFREKLKRFAA